MIRKNKLIVEKKERKNKGTLENYNLKGKKTMLTWKYNMYSNINYV